MLTKTLSTLAVVTVVGAAIIAQERPPQAKPAPSTPAPAIPPPQGRGEQPSPAKAEPKAVKEPVGQPVNIKLEITITDQAGPEPAKKVVTMLLADRAVGSIRSNGVQRIPSEGNYPVSINVDATPTLLTDGNIRLNLGLEYQPRPSPSSSPSPSPSPSDQMLTRARMSTLNERLSIIVQDGKPILISQAADPGSDRRITVELKATVVK